jgi:hypothetical protein
MTKLPQDVVDGWNTRLGATVFSTVDLNKRANSIYVMSIALHESGCFVIADNYFNKTKQNILNKSRGSLLFITKENISYQVKGRIEYYSEGSYYDFIRQNTDKKYPVHGCAVLFVEEAYSGEKVLI